jgi:hypothetical protein
MPPVPPGFSPAGVVAAAEPKAPDRRSKVKWASGAAAAAVLGGLVAGLGPGEPEPPAVPQFTIVNTSPGPGGDFSLSRDRLSVLVTVSGEPAEPLTLTWFFTLHASIREACVTMTDTVSLGSERPVTLELSALVRINGFCGPTFNVNTAKLTIVVDGQVAHEVQQEHRLRVIP